MDRAAIIGRLDRWSADVVALTVHYVAGYGRSGSTALDLRLTRDHGAFSVGEITFLFDHFRQGRSCACGHPFDECEFWRDLFADHLARPVSEQLHREQLFRALDSRILRGERRTEAEAIHLHVLHYAHERSGGLPLVDSSKSGWKAWRRVAWLAGAPGIDLRVVLLLRSPVGIAAALYRGTNASLIETGVQPSLSRAVRGGLFSVVINGLSVITLTMSCGRRWRIERFSQLFAPGTSASLVTADDHGVVGSRWRTKDRDDE